MGLVEALAPFLGSAALEVLHWFDLREKLDLQRHRKLLRSPGYWIITVLTGMVGGLVTLVLFNGQGAAKLLLAGAAFPVLFRKLVTTLASRKHAMLGDDVLPERGSALRDYFTVA